MYGVIALVDKGLIGVGDLVGGSLGGCLGIWIGG